MFEKASRIRFARSDAMKSLRSIHSCVNGNRTMSFYFVVCVECGSVIGFRPDFARNLYCGAWQLTAIMLVGRPVPSVGRRQRQQAFGARSAVMSFLRIDFSILTFLWRTLNRVLY